ncbi:DUF968 domain-containing protein [Hoeflea sp. TYP-13]|uniref:DUF968 domain-containing protein n=1 Tax=Hoeflea sp. TYP-13 TaxID=3230023 RepID=UPI0034C6493A
MSAFRIIKPDLATASKATAPVKNRPYLSWLHKLPCIVTLQVTIQAAHLSTANRAYGHLGRGKGRKASDRWILPLCQAKHDEQTYLGDELKFWRRYGINPHVACLTLHGLWTDLGDDATEFATAIILSREIGR